MDFGIEELKRICKEALYEAHSVLDSLGEAGTPEIYDEHVDISTRGDRAVSEALTRFFEERMVPAVLYSEESGRVELTEKPRYTIVFDEIDGTNNYHRGGGFLPYCTVVSIFDSIEPRFEDALVAGILEHTSKRLWCAVKKGGCYLNDSKVKTSGRKILDRRALVVIDHYISGENVQRFSRIYPSAWVKDFGSAALHFAGVSSGLFDAYLSPSQKAHELGAGYLLIKEAGGFFADLSGNPLDRERYDFNARYPIIAASTEKLGRTLLSRIE